MSFKSINDLREQFGRNLMLFTERIHSQYFFFIFFSIFLAYSVTIKKFVFNAVRIKSLFALLFFFRRFLDHSHHNLLKIFRSHYLRSDWVSDIVIIDFWKHEKFIFDSEARLYKFDDIGEAIVNCNIKIAESQKISIFCYGNFTVVDSFDDFKDFFFFFIAFDFVHHIINQETIHFCCVEIVIQTERSFWLHHKFFVQSRSLLTFVDNNQDSFMVSFGQIRKHSFEFVLLGCFEYNHIVSLWFRLINFDHSHIIQQSFVVLRHKSMVESKNSIGIGFGNKFL